MKHDEKHEPARKLLREAVALRKEAASKEKDRMRKLMKASADQGIHSNNDTRQFEYWESDDEKDRTGGGMFPDLSEFEPGSSALDIAYKRSTPEVIEVVEKASLAT